MAVHWETQRCIFKEFLLHSSHLQSPGNAGEVIIMVNTYWGLDAGCSVSGTVLSILTSDITLIPHNSLDVSTFYRWGHWGAKVRYLAQGYTAGRRQNQDLNPALQTLNQNYYTASYHPSWPCPVKLFSSERDIRHFDVILTVLPTLHILILTIMMKLNANFPIKDKSARGFLLLTKMK